MTQPDANKDQHLQHLNMMTSVVLTLGRAMQSVHKAWLEDLIDNCTVKLCRTVSDAELTEQTTLDPDYLGNLVQASYVPWAGCTEANKLRLLAGAQALLTHLVDNDRIQIGFQNALVHPDTFNPNAKLEKKVLVSYSDSWADEIDVKGSQVWVEAEWMALVDEVSEAFATTNNDKFRITNYVGTNEEIMYTSFRQWRDAYTVKELSPTEVLVLEEYADQMSGAFWVPEYFGED